jgi:hypothetical protein
MYSRKGTSNNIPQRSSAQLDDFTIYSNHATGVYEQQSVLRDFHDDSLSSHVRAKNETATSSKAAPEFSSSVSSLSSTDLELQWAVVAEASKDKHNDTYTKQSVRVHHNHPATLDLKAPPQKEMSLTDAYYDYCNMNSKFTDQAISSTARKSKSTSQEQKSVPSFHRAIIDIVPGMSMAYIGSSETIHAFQQNHCIDTVCLECDTSLYCSDSASYILCSICESISPVLNDNIDELTTTTTTTSTEETDPLFGLGMTLAQITV